MLISEHAKVLPFDVTFVPGLNLDYLYDVPLKIAIIVIFSVGRKPSTPLECAVLLQLIVSLFEGLSLLQSEGVQNLQSW